MNKNHGFTLVEVLVTTVLVAVAVVGVLGGIRSIGAADVKARTADLLQRLAAEKLHDLKVLPDPSDAPDSGDYSDRGYADITWNLAIEATGANNVDQVTVTTTRGGDSQALTTLMFVSPSAGASDSTTGTP